MADLELQSAHSTGVAEATAHDVMPGVTVLAVAYRFKKEGELFVSLKEITFTSVARLKRVGFGGKGVSQAYSIYGYTADTSDRKERCVLADIGIFSYDWGLSPLRPRGTFDDFSVVVTRESILGLCAEMESLHRSTKNVAFQNATNRLRELYPEWLS